MKGNNGVTTVWGIHNDTPIDFAHGGFISIGWDKVGNLEQVGASREKLKQLLASEYPETKAAAIPGWAGILYRFGSDMKVGDVVVAPYKPDSTVNIGVVSGAYYFAADEPTHRHRRPVDWKVLGIARPTFSQPALWEIGASQTLFKVKTHSDEFLAALAAGSADAAATAVAAHTGGGEGAQEVVPPRADQITQQTRDFVLDRLKNGISHQQFEVFVADLMRAHGYEARVTQQSGDGNVDVIAHRDPLGIEPPVIKIQVKQEIGSKGGPDIQQLVGSLAPGDLGVFITLGGYTKDAVGMERTRQGLRLVDGNALVDLVLQAYDRLPDVWRNLLPLARVLVVDDSADA